MRGITLVLLVCTAVKAVPTNPHRIVGGSATTVNQYPTLAALLYSLFGVTPFNQACGGIILTRRAILTAGHCPYGDSVVRWRIRVGSTYANSGGTVYSLISIIIHPNYNSFTYDNDIAILKTANSITYSNVVQPASIASSNYYLGDNEVVWAAGWGTTNSGGSPSEQLRHVQLWTINQAICRSRYTSIGRTVTDNMVCSGWLDVGGRDQCQGDSGGPLYHNNVVVGVCSWGASCASPLYPGVNTRVSRFTAWIQTNA